MSDYTASKYKASESKHRLGHFPCPFPDCNSSDAFAIWEQDGKKNGTCFSCGKSSLDPERDRLIHKPHLHWEGISSDHDTQVSSSAVSSSTKVANTVINLVTNTKDSRNAQVSVEEGLTHPCRALPHRKLNLATAMHFNVRCGVSPVDGESHIYTLFPRYRDQELIGWKSKDNDKNYVSTGGGDVDLFGAHCLNPTGKRLWITEGPEDAMALYQVLKEGSSLQDWEPPVVSLPDGSPSAVKSILRSMPLIDGYEEIVLCFDNDAAGKKARDEVCKLLAGKVYFITLPLKDANEMLLQGRGKELKWKAYSYTKYQPDGIVNAKDLWERYKEKKDLEYVPYPEILEELNKKLYGLRFPSITTWTAGTGLGKTQLLRELLYHYITTTDYKIGGMFLEEDIIDDTIKGQIALHLGKRINLPDVKVSEEEEHRSFNDLFSSGRITFYDWFGGMDDTSLLSKLRYLANDGCRIIFLDHLSIIVSEHASEGGERERIDTLMTKLAKFVKEYKVGLHLVVHLRKPDGSRTSFELGAKPTLDDLRGSAAIKQLSWDVIGLSRNQQHEDERCKNITEITILKTRLAGRTGTTDYLLFNEQTGRYQKVEKPSNYHYSKKSNDYNEEF